jgi:hypothetical protein
VDDGPTEAIEDGAEVVEGPADVQVRDVDVPVFMRILYRIKNWQMLSNNVSSEHAFRYLSGFVIDPGDQHHDDLQTYL